MTKIGTLMVVSADNVTSMEKYHHGNFKPFMFLTVEYFISKTYICIFGVVLTMTN